MMLLGQMHHFATDWLEQNKQQESSYYKHSVRLSETNGNSA